MKKIYVDADACPVKDEVTKVAIRNKISTYMVCNGGIRPFKNLLIKLINLLIQIHSYFNILSFKEDNKLTLLHKFKKFKLSIHLFLIQSFKFITFIILILIALYSNP